MKAKILTRSIWILSLVSLFNDVATEMLYPIMPVYLKSIGFSIVLIGVLEGFVEATAGISKGYFGQMSDRIGLRVPFIKAGYALSAFAKPLLALFTYPWWIFIVRSIERLGKGIRTSARDAFLSDQTIPEHKGKVFGFHRSLDTVGAAIGPLISLSFLFYFPEKYKLLFLFSFIPGIIAVALTFVLRDKKLVPSRSQRKFHFFSFLGYWKRSNSQFKWLVTGLFLFALINSSDAFILMGLKEKGYTDYQMIGFYIFYNLMYAALSYPIGILADKFGIRKMLLFGIAMFGIMYLCFGFVGSTLLLMLLFIIYGIYASATEGMAKALITNISTKEETATAIGFYNSILSVCTLIASSFGGFLWFTFSSKVMFTFSGVGAFVIVIYFLVVRKRFS